MSNPESESNSTKKWRGPAIGLVFILAILGGIGAVAAQSNDTDEQHLNDNDTGETHGEGKDGDEGHDGEGSEHDGDGAEHDGAVEGSDHDDDGGGHDG